MSVKQFFKSQTFKCLVVLLCISLIAGGLLAILSDVFYVSDEERTARAIKAIYGREVGYEVCEISDADASNKYGTLDQVYLLEDGNYLIRATGGGGYKGGTVSVWAAVRFKDGAFDGLDKVVIDTYEKQTLMSELNSKFLTVYSSHNEELIGGATFTEGDGGVSHIVTGATYSSTAANNAVNCALFYARSIFDEGGSNE